MPGPGRRGPQGKQAKPKNAGKTIKRLFSYLGGFKLPLVIVFFCILINAGAGIMGNYMIRPILNDYIMPLVGQENPDLTKFATLLLTMLLIYLMGAFASWLNSRLMLHISTKVLFKIRTELFEHMEMLPIKYFDTHTHGDLMSRYTNDTDTLRDMLSQALPQLFSSALTVVSSFVMMAVLSPVLLIIMLISIVIVVLITAAIGKRSAKAFRDQQKALGKVNGYIEELIEGQKVVKVFCHEETAKAEFEELNNTLCEAGTRANTLANIMGPTMNNMGHVNYAVTAMVGVMLIIRGTTDLGTVAAFLQYSKNFIHPVTQIAQLFNGILNALAGAERIFGVIDEPMETDEGYVTLVNANILPDGTVTEAFLPTGQWAWKHPHQADGSVTYTPLKGEVQFDDVTFGYVENKTVLHNITLTAKPGQKIALVGSTGSGKTTITNLINRFYDVAVSEEGASKIRIDGINVTKIKKADLRRSLSMVLQDTHLFTGTIAENIRFGKLDASQTEIEAAAKLANADYFIRHLSEGYGTVITGDGGNLSQGQRQLLAIARAAVANPPILILDEATSSIDTRTEALIETGMDSLMKGRTTFVIAHRLSTVRNADQIVVLENGRIIEKGTHDELIAAKGRYYQLYTGSFAK